MGGIFNASLVIMIVATMFNAGLATTTKALGAVLKNVWLVVLTLIVAFHPPAPGGLGTGGDL